MNIKSLISSKKKVIISCVIGFLIGTGIAIPNKEIKAMKIKNTEIEAQILDKDTLLTSNKKDLESLQDTYSEYQIQKNDILRAKEEEQERIAKEKEEKAKQERLAREKQEKAEKEKAQSLNSIQNKQIEKSKVKTKSVISNNSNSSNTDNSANFIEDNTQNDKTAMVWRTRTGKKYHSTNHCGNTNSSTATEITLSEAEAEGLTACSKCY